MRSPEYLLLRLGVVYYTARHIKLIEDFLKSGNQNIEELLNQLGGWDGSDLVIAKKWFNNEFC